MTFSLLFLYLNHQQSTENRFSLFPELGGGGGGGYVVFKTPINSNLEEQSGVHTKGHL